MSEVARTPHHARRSGFTLLEVLVASALFLILLTLLLTVISSTTAIASKTSEQIEATRIARESLDLIGRDIVSASIPWSRTNTASLQFVVNPTNVSVPANSMNSDVAFWQAPLVRNATNGNLAIVGYFVLRDFSANSRNSRLQLRRAYIEPSTTSANYKIYSDPSNWIQASTFSDFGPSDAATDNSNAQRGWVADGVLGIWIRCLDKTGTVIANTTNSSVPGFDSRLGFRITNKQWYPTNYSALPAFVEVTLVCMAPRELAKLGTLPATPTTTTNVNFPSIISSYVDQIRANNPGVKSISSFSRKFRLQNSD